MISKILEVARLDAYAGYISMSVLVGTLSGVLVAGGVYYGFSNMMHTRTELHRRDLNALSSKMSVPLPATMDAPPPAAERIAHSPMKALLKSRWNEQVEGLVKSAGSLEQNMSEWSRKWLYGGARN